MKLRGVLRTGRLNRAPGRVRASTQRADSTQAWQREWRPDEVQRSTRPRMRVGAVPVCRTPYLQMLNLAVSAGRTLHQPAVGVTAAATVL
jgi:hypothetical protein